MKNDKKGDTFGTIMKIKVSSTSVEDVLRRVKTFISDSDKFYIVTPNPELILMAQTNNRLQTALNSAKLSIPDGVGLKLADSNLKIIKGRQLFLKLIELAESNEWKVYFLGGLGHEAEAAADKLRRKYKHIKILTNEGPKLDKDANPVSEVDIKIQNDAITGINKFSPQLLFVAFGNPKQEIWVNNNLSKLHIGGAMTVGGTFRYVAGMSKLPPKWVETNGLEWLWRVFTEPKRIGRIINAVIVFPIKYFFYKFN